MYSLTTDKETRVYLFDVVKGLVSESDKLKAVVNKIEFQVGTLPVSKEGVAALKSVTKKDDEFSMSTPEIAYARNLQSYGEVRIPPPSYLVLLDYCRERDIRIEGIDMDEEHYTSAYCKYVSGLELIRQSLWEKRLMKKNINPPTSKEFVLQWDELINKYTGFRKLERHREKVMSKNIRRLSRKFHVLSVIELERVEGILEKMKDWGWDEDSS